MSATIDIVRCPWRGIADPMYTRYHDEEWGVPKADDRALFEKLVLEGFQAGLSWLTILRKRESFRSAFHGFDAGRIARYTDADIARLMADAGIVRNRMKVEATVTNARALLKLQERTSLAAFLWAFLEGRPQINRHASFKTVPAETPISKAMSKALLAEGFRFVGPTTIYAFMQAVGMVNDHLVGCFRHEPCAKLQASFRLQGTEAAPAAGPGPRAAPSGTSKPTRAPKASARA
jgi:DNA-3-methyladenine glycosylase I